MNIDSKAIDARLQASKLGPINPADFTMRDTADMEKRIS